MQWRGQGEGKGGEGGGTQCSNRGVVVVMVAVVGVVVAPRAVHAAMKHRLTKGPQQ